MRPLCGWVLSQGKLVVRGLRGWVCYVVGWLPLCSWMFVQVVMWGWTRVGEGDYDVFGLMGGRLVVSVIMVLLGLFGGDGPDVVPDWERYVRIGRYDPAGFECYDGAGEGRKVVRRLFFKAPLYRVTEVVTADGLVEVRDAKGSCFVADDAVAALHSRPFSCLTANAPQPLVAIGRLAKSQPPSPEAGRAVGKFFPTFYQIAREVLYPGDGSEENLTTLRDNDGKRIAKVSRAFRKALLRQGTGQLRDGRVLNVGKKLKSGRRFIVLPKESYGLGTSNFHLYPYRSVAVDFDFLCGRLKDDEICAPGNVDVRDRSVSRANRKGLAGMLLYLPRFKGVQLEDGSIHDGYVCAVDVGGGIKLDRIDLFVGGEAAGNPYYPPCRSSNSLIRSGIESLIPSDWHTFERDEEGVWKRSVAAEYRQFAPEKGLEVIAFPGIECRRHVD